MSCKDLIKIRWILYIAAALLLFIGADYMAIICLAIAVSAFAPSLKSSEFSSLLLASNALVGVIATIYWGLLAIYFINNKHYITDTPLLYTAILVAAPLLPDIIKFEYSEYRKANS